MELKEYLFPDNLHYTKKHTWCKKEGEIILIGIDSYAVRMAGEIEFIDLPKLGTKVDAMKGFGTLESAKWVGEMLSPVSGEVVEINKNILENLENLKKDPYSNWLIKIKPSNLNELNNLITGPEKIKEWLGNDIT